MTVENYFIFFLIFMLGASIASFLAVYVERGKDSAIFSLKKDNGSRSYCSNCLRQLDILELVPVFSYLFLIGKCKSCKTRIPIALFLSEVTLGIWFLAALFLANTIPELILVWIFGSVFTLLCLEDWDSMQVSANFLYVFMSLGIIMSLVRFFTEFSSIQLYLPLLIFSPMWFIYYLNKNWMGEADPYVFTGLGLFFGAQFSVSLFLYSVWFGAIFGILYLIFINKKLERNIPIPFLPVILFSTLFISITNYHFIKISDILLINEILFK